MIKHIPKKKPVLEIVVMLLVIRGSAHQDCTLKLRINAKELKILVIFHNLRGYDSHFIMQEIGEIAKKNNKPLKKEVKSSKWIINVIPNNMEKHMAFMLGKHLVFLVFQFTVYELKS